MLYPTINFVKFLPSLEALEVQLVYGEGVIFSLQEVLPHQRADAKSAAQVENLSVTELN